MKPRCKVWMNEKSGELGGFKDNGSCYFDGIPCHKFRRKSDGDVSYSCQKHAHFWDNMGDYWTEEPVETCVENLFPLLHFSDEEAEKLEPAKSCDPMLTKSWINTKGEKRFICKNHHRQGEVPLETAIPNLAYIGDKDPVYPEAVWEEIPVEKPAEPVASLLDSHGYPVYSIGDAKSHQNSGGYEWFCEQKENGIDGTTDHWGPTFALGYKGGGCPAHTGQSASYVFSCLNHAIKYTERPDIVASDVGMYDLKPCSELPVLAKFMGCPIPETPASLFESSFQNCWYYKNHKSTDCGGPITGYYASPNEEDWDPVCENHYNSLIKQGYTWLRPYSGVPSTPPSGKIIRDKIRTGATIRTQKAKGLATLRNFSFPVPSFGIYDAEGCDPVSLVGKFVRPCPMRPRHGFVDSRPIATKEEAEAIIKQTLEADSEAEFLLMDHINAPFSGIWTPGYLAVGKGTDGATAGTSSIMIPIDGDYLPTVYKYNPTKILKDANIKDAPYIEILWVNKKKSAQNFGSSQDYEVNTVQLRDGPTIPPKMTEFIPFEFEVTRVLTVHMGDDLLAWETAMREEGEKIKSGERGVIVYHPGGSMASHFSVHAFLNGVPVIFDHEPLIGEKIVPKEEAKREPNIGLIRAGFVLACKTNITFERAAQFMLLGCHSTADWLGSQDLLVGASMGFAWRLSVAAALGEERHYHKSKLRGKHRDIIYKEAWGISDTPEIRDKFVDALDKFLNGTSWPSGGSHGGYLWWRFTSNAAIMYNCLIAKDIKGALEALNRLVNSAHNTGWGFNKFIGKDQMDKTAKSPIYAGMLVGPYLYMLLTTELKDLKTAHRSFWKRLPLTLPEDMGTGINHPDHESEEEPEEEEEELVDEHEEGCDCGKCKTVRFQQGWNKPQEVEYAQAKIAGVKKSGGVWVHIQFKSENTFGKHYYKIDVPVPNFDIANLGDDTVKTTSLAESETEYFVLSFHETHWGVYDKEGKFIEIIPKEVTPVAG